MQTTTTFRTVYEIYAPSLPINESRRITHEWGSPIAALANQYGYVRLVKVGANWVVAN